MLFGSVVMKFCDYFKPLTFYVSLPHTTHHAYTSTHLPNPLLSLG